MDTAPTADGSGVDGAPEENQPEQQPGYVWGLTITAEAEVIPADQAEEDGS